MSPETLITILSFAVAIYALLPLERALDLKVKFAWYDWLVVLAAIGVVHYILYFPLLQENGWALDLGPWRWGFNASLATYTIIIVTAAWIILRLHFGGLRRQRVFAFSRLATELLHKRKNGELAELVGRYLPKLMKIYNNGFVLTRLRDRLAPPSWTVLMRHRKKRSKFARFVGAKVALLLPRYEKSRDSARQTVQRIVLSDQFVLELATAYPYMGIEILAHELREAEGFQEKWFECLLDDTNSVIYTEIEHNQSMQMGAYHRYEYRPENRCLWFYFNDVSVAERLHVYRPIGDYLTSMYNKRHRGPENDRFNQPLDQYADTEIWRCPAHTVLRLFDYMISESLYQGIPWHMWLHYLPSFSEKIVRNLSPGTSVDPNAEFPTPYHYQLYEIVSLLCKWIASAKDLPVYDSAEPRDRAIPMQSVIAMGRVFSTLLLANKLDDRFNANMLEVALGRADDWRNEPKLEPYRQALVTTLASGGRDWGVPNSWPQMLAARLLDLDSVRHHRIIADVNLKESTITGASGFRRVDRPEQSHLIVVSQRSSQSDKRHYVLNREHRNRGIQ